MHGQIEGHAARFMALGNPLRRSVLRLRAGDAGRDLEAAPEGANLGRVGLQSLIRMPPGGTRV